MIKKYNRDLDVIKTIDEEYKDDDIWEGGRAFSLDVLNMNRWSLHGSCQHPAPLELKFWLSHKERI